MPELQQKPALEKAKSFFEHNKKPLDATNGFSDKLNNLNARLKIIEERYTGLRRKTQFTEQNMININKKVSTEVKTISSDINEVSHSMFEITTKIKEIKEELSRCAKKNDVQLLEKYMSFWEPLNYVTADDVKKIVENILSKKQNENFK